MSIPKGSVLKDLKGQITFGRSHGGNSDETPIRIEVIDEASGIMLVTVRMDLATFADALMGSGHASCTLQANLSDKIGRKSETRTVLVPFEWHGEFGDEAGKRAAALKAMKPFLVDGWEEFRESDLFNHHCSVRNDKKAFQNVIMWRWLP